MRDALLRLSSIAFVAVICACAIGLYAQPPSTVPPGGLRDNTPTAHALVHATIVMAAGKSIDDATLILRDGMIVSVGVAKDVTIPAEAQVWDCAGKTIYPGLIDAFTELPADASKTDPALADASGARYWNAQIVPQVRGDRIYKPDAELNKKLRAQGIVARLAAPSFGLLKGTSALVTTSDETGSKSTIRAHVAQHVALTPARGPRGGGDDDTRGYPTSPMGAFALVRQAIYDAQWYEKAWKAHSDDAAIGRPEQNDALAALSESIREKQAFIIDSADELYFARADQIGREFAFSNVIVRGSGQEYRRLGDLAAMKRPVLVPVNFPKAPNVATPENAANVSLEDLMDWDISPENPARLEKAGVTIAFTSNGLRDKAAFLAGVKKSVVRGLSNDAALKAMTSTPAMLFGADKMFGSIEVGKSASFVITDGELFGEKTKVLETWIDGKRYEIAPQPLVSDPRGKWAVKLGQKTLNLTVTGELDKLSAKLAGDSITPSTQPETAPTTNPTTTPATKPSDADLQHVSLSAARLSFNIKGELIGAKGIVQVSVNLIDEDPQTWLGSAVQFDGTTTPVTATRTASVKEVMTSQPSTQPTDAGTNDTTASTAAPPTEMTGGTTRTVQPTTQASPSGPGSADARESRRGRSMGDKPPVIKNALYPVNYPLGDFGRENPPDRPSVIIYKNATIWTCEDKPRKFVGSVVVRGGKIESISEAGEEGMDGATVIDCNGKHLTPGIIDCHSHIATDGGVNESGQAVTAEVRIGDFINPDDISIYRQIASGGVTTSNILHGSANPIGGQNQVLKFRWGSNGEQMKFEGAPQGIKFALGENVKQSNWDIPDGKRTRYPQTRMGVEQIVRDEFKAAQDYQRAFKEYEENPKGKLPPRKDLELDAICEILNHTRWIHCHSYRQDEILALLRTLEEFNVQIGTLQHILEGYKVADAMKKHGAMASSFADWWAYKFEVYDAIAFNGALMHDVGIVVSFNSDDAEMARRLNLEAAKAMKYGGVSDVEALKFVTLNPAKQLRIDNRVGSIEVGKDADLVLWSGSPLSTFSRPVQVWIDGRKYFDRADDLAMRTKMREMRAALIQRILVSGEAFNEPDEREPRERAVWADEDVYDR